MTGPAWRRYRRFWRRDPTADAEDELRFHIESRMQDLIADGMTPGAARAEAERRFGDLDRVRQHCVDVEASSERSRNRRAMWDALGQDLRYGGRALRRRPGFSIVAVLTLALGIGANTALFSVVNGVLLRPLPYRDSDRLVRLFTAFRGQGIARYAMSQPEFMDYQGLTRTFVQAAAFGGANLTLTGTGEPERLRGLAATRDLLPVLGIVPARGRNFEGDEGRQGTERVVIVTDDLWRTRFGGDPALLGRTLTLNGIARRVIGILPPDATFERAQAIIPIFINPDSMTGRSSNYLSGVARLAPHVSVADAQRALDALTRQTAVTYARNYPAAMGYGATVVSMRDEIVGDVRPALLILLGAVALVLLIACANVANLLLAHGEARQREIAIRIALGAHRRRILRQLLTESTVLSLAGAVAGVVLAWWGVRAILAVNPDAIPRMQEIRIDWTVGAATLGIALATGILFGLMPALQLVRPALHATLKEGARGGSESGQRHRLGRALVSGEIALAVVVVIGAALLVRSFVELRTADPGFRSDHLLVVDLAVPESRYDIAATTAFYRQLVERAAALPGVEVAAAASDIPPFANGNNWDIDIDGRTTAPGEADPSPNVRAVTGGYFRAIGTTAVRGRLLGPEDTQGAMPVGVINETAARTIWQGRDPIGQRVRFGSRRPWITIVGVVRDAHSMGLAEPAPAEMFLPHEQIPVAWNATERAMYLMLRTRGDPALLAAPARQIVRSLDPLLAIFAVRSMDEVMDRAVAQPRFTMLLLGAFGAVALALAAIGIYGVLSYAVKRRTREIGIRMALGGQPRHVLWLVVGQGMRLALVGLTIGVVAAFAVTRLMGRLLYGVSPSDPLSFAAITILLALVALVASWLPARRAIRTDPRAALSD